MYVLSAVKFATVCHLKIIKNNENILTKRERKNGQGLT